GKDKLVSSSDEVFNDFVVYKEPKADLVLEMQWLWLHKTKIDPYNEKISIYGKVVPFYKNLSDDLESNISNNTTYESLSLSSSGSDSDSSSYKVIVMKAK
ncbi:5666_t:CDS:2, partial [Racocetra fulgida]